MKKYLNPQVEVLEFSIMDVLTLSGPEILDTNETPGVSLLSLRNRAQ